MIKEIIEGLSKILGSIATISKDKREQKDMALRAISNALDETLLYYRDLERGKMRDLDREALLCKYWSSASIPMRHFDAQLAGICEYKSKYWLNPTQYTDTEIRELGIGLNDVRQAYRRMLLPEKFSTYRRKS